MYELTFTRLHDDLHDYLYEVQVDKKYKNQS